MLSDVISPPGTGTDLKPRGRYGASVEHIVFSELYIYIDFQLTDYRYRPSFSAFL